jgi:hypothetical protein
MLMIDLLTYEFPYGQLGRLFNAVYFNQYIERYLQQKIALIKNYAETDRWKKLLVR